MTTLPALIAADHWAHGPHWWFLIPLLFWGTLIFLLVTRVRRCGGRFGPSGRNGESVLAERYAKGEIDADEYRDRLTVLRERGK